MEDAARPTASADAAERKPRLALMGEFSAGKSTLTNLLIGDTRIPMRVTATQLPPVWLSYGTDAPYREDLNGQRHPIDAENIDGIPVRDTAFIRLFAEAEVLEVCDVIDTPGISDPNMPPEVWQRAAAEADGVLWLTHATQAWRQSEAAVWSEMPEELWAHSLLLVTRVDKILTSHDRERVLNRIRREAGHMFRAILPISLTQALAAGDDDAALWASSGGEALSAALLDLIQLLARNVRMHRGKPAHERPAFQSSVAPLPRAPAVRSIKVGAAPESDAHGARPEAPPPNTPQLHVVSDNAPGEGFGALPRRVVPSGDAALRAVRPPRSDEEPESA